MSNRTRKLFGLLILTTFYGIAGCDGDSDTSTDTATKADTASAPSDTTGPVDTKVTPDTVVTDVGPTLDVPVAPDVPAPPDTGKPDVPGPTGALCPDLFGCLADACKDAGDAAQCTSDNLVGCGAGDAMNAEATSATALADCANNRGCPLDLELGATYSCIRRDCQAQAITCYAPNPTGVGSCSDVNACVAQCPKDVFGEPDIGCIRGCLEQGTEQSVGLWFDLKLCIDTECIDAQDYDICGQQVVNTPSCTDPFVECQGNEGK